VKFVSRQFRQGDDASINALYRAVTGRVRSDTDFAWQWLEAPAGQGEIWLIETADSSPKGDGPDLVGHHGLMPLFFSSNGKTFVAGKTENTMVDPGFRRKLLYPKFEKQFLADYSERFDVLFSTIGPAAPLRQRKALGYDDSRSWLFLEIGLRPFALPGLLAAMADMNRKPQTGLIIRTLLGMLRLAAGAAQRLPSGRATFDQDLVALSDHDAKEHQFFDTFWKGAAGQFAMTPRREKPDLAWRFWDNPHVEYTTLIHPNGYAIVSRPHKYIFRLEDIVASPYDEYHFNGLMRAVCSWCKSQRAAALLFATTDDAASPAELIKSGGFQLLSDHPFRKLMKSGEPRKMLRKLTPRGIESGADVDNWYVTRFVMEGVT
jgi:hypothetical protein